MQCFVLPAPGVSAARRRCNLYRGLVGILELRGLLLRRYRVVRRAGPKERSAGDRIERRGRAFDAGSVFTPAVGKCGLRACDNREAYQTESDDTTLSQAQLLFDFSRSRQPAFPVPGKIMRPLLLWCR